MNAKTRLLIALLIFGYTTTYSQSRFDAIKNWAFPPEGVETIIMITKPEVRVYDKPNGKKREDSDSWLGGYEAIVLGPAVYGVKMHPSGWPYIFNGKASGFLNPADFTKPKFLPFEPWMFNTAVVKTAAESNMRVGLNKATGLYLIEIRPDKSEGRLQIGQMMDGDKMIYSRGGPTCFFKYLPAQKGVSVTTKKNTLYSPDPFLITYGKDYAITTMAGTRINLETIPEDALAIIFKQELEDATKPTEYTKPFDNWNDIEYSQWDGDDYYYDAIIADLLSPPYVDKAAAIAAYNAAHKSDDVKSQSSPNNSSTLVNPKFKGDLDAWLIENLKYPTVALEEGAQGTIKVSFVVKADGTVANVKPLDNFNTYLAHEACRVVSSMPKWIPGTYNGKPADIRLTIPITFKINQPTIKTY